jgi:ubiquinone/menaquinone biosynthesis C-methylase UbiE
MGQMTDAPARVRRQARAMTSIESAAGPQGPTESFQIPVEAAELYEAAFVPGFFAQWAPTLCDVAGVAPGQSVLDVACGTGIVARTAAAAVGPRGKVAGLDLNEAMLTVARRVGHDIEWHPGDAAALPFADQAFDVVLCQMALMFLPDRRGALSEMARVTSDGGTVAVLVPAGLDDQAAFRPFVQAAEAVVGPEAASLLTTYFACGDLDELTALVREAGITVTASRTVTGTYGATSVDSAVTTEVESTPLVGLIDDATYAELRHRAHEVWAPFTTAEGRLEAPFRCHVVAGTPAR